MGGARVGPEIVASRARRREGRDSGYAWASLDTLGRVGCSRARGLAGSGQAPVSKLSLRIAVLLVALVAAALLGVASCADTTRTPPAPREATAVQQPVLRPRAAPPVASPSAETAPAPPIATQPPAGTAPPPPNQAAFVQVATGENHTCALRSDGSVECWGPNDHGQQDVPKGLKFRQIASGWHFTCGITTDGGLTCWGRNNHKQADPPAGQFTDVSAGWDHACAIAPGGATCWGRSSNDRTAVPPDVSFTAIGAGAEHSCGLTTSGELVCWGKNDNGRAESRTGPFRALAVGVAHTCALRSDGTAFCQGESANGQPQPPETAFDHISAGSDRTCGTLPTGQVECWDAKPSTAPIETFGPTGTYTSISVGWHDACGINDVPLIVCWTRDWSFRPSPYSRPSPYNRLLIESPFPEVELSRPVEVFPWTHGGLAVADKTGSLAALSAEFGSRPILDLTDVVHSDGSEAGMLSAAIDPDFERFPFLYVYYTMQDKNDEDRLFTRLSRFPVADGIGVRDEEFIILNILRNTRSEIHWGGGIRFGPDDMLYLGIGDGECRKCPQSLDTLHGKIIRIDVRGASADTPYRIPDDNPMRETPDARPEIWAYGLRNPWRMAFDPQDGTLWVGDVGEASEEEVSIATRGANLGWPIFEGFSCLESADMTNTDPKLVSAYLCHETPGFTKPVVSYNHEVGCAVVGGIVYRGTAIPWLTGVYLFGDYCTGRVWALAGDADSGWLMLEVADLDQQLSSFGTDANGEVLILTFDGPLRRLVDAEAVYAPSVTHKTLTTIVRAPLDTRAPPTPRVRGP